MYQTVPVEIPFPLTDQMLTDLISSDKDAAIMSKICKIFQPFALN